MKAAATRSATASHRGRTLRLVWPLAAMAATTLLLLQLANYGGLAVGGAVDAERLWSQAEHTAVLALTRYSGTLAESDHRAAAEALDVIHGYRDAFAEAGKSDARVHEIVDGLRRGRLSSDEIPGVIALFRTLRDVGVLGDIVDDWTRADAAIRNLERADDAFHRAALLAPPAAADIESLRAQLAAVDREFTPLEQSISAHVAAGARKLSNLINLVTWLAVAILLVAGSWLSWRATRRNDEFEQALKLSQERFDLAVSGSSDGLWDWDLATNEVYYSPRLRELLHFADAPIDTGLEGLLEQLHRDDRDGLRAQLRGQLRHDSPIDMDFRCRAPNGEYRWRHVRGRAFRNARGRVVRMAGSVSDISDRKRVEAQLYAEKERAEVTLESIGDAVITTDSSGQVDYMNAVAETLSGWSAADAWGRSLQQICPMMSGVAPRESKDPIRQVLHDGTVVKTLGHTMLLSREGTEIAINASASPIRDRSGEVVGAVLVLRDVRRERADAARWSYQASHDALTGLINRREFETRLTRLIEEIQESGARAAMLYLDLDQFKIVNDTCGHDAGDQLMRQLGAVLQANLRPGDTLARLGGDEFGALLEDCSPAHAKRIADTLCEAVGRFRFNWNERHFSLGVSIGLVDIRGGFKGLAEVLRAGDLACYLAKERGRNRVQVYRATDHDLSLRRDEVEWFGRINQALQEDRFCLYEQTIESLQPRLGQGSHRELLLRMLGSNDELIPPMSFIPAAQRYTLMPSIDRWVIRNAFAAIARLLAQKAISREDVFAINLSGQSIGDEQFLDFIRDAAARSRIPPQMICLEITETFAISNLRRATEFMAKLSGQGFRFALDDFGAGMSSFGYLKHLPVDYIKIDGSFVRDILADSIGEAMVVAINDIGHLMGKLTIAEGVESLLARKRLYAIGVDFVQGHAISEPKPFMALDGSTVRILARSAG